MICFGLFGFPKTFQDGKNPKYHANNPKLP
jgi:hypothetical protein